MSKNSWDIRRIHNFGTNKVVLPSQLTFGWSPPLFFPFSSLFFSFCWAFNKLHFGWKSFRENHEDILKEVHFSLVCLNEPSSFRYGSKDLAPSSWQKYMEGSYKVQNVSISVKIDDVTSDTKEEALQ